MTYNKIISILSIILLLTIMPTYAASEDSSFTLFGIDFAKAWDYIAFWKDETPKTSNPTTSTKKTGTYTPPVNFNISLGSTIYTRSQLISMMNNNKQVMEYVKGFNYECMSVETDEGEKITLYFNTDTGKVTNIKHSLNCEKQITIEASLIDEIMVQGFQASKIKSYLERVELPTTMYFKAVKVFTVG